MPSGDSQELPPALRCFKWVTQSEAGSGQVRGFGVGEVHNNPQKNIDDLPKVVEGVLDQLHVNPSPGNFRRRGPGPGPARRPGYYPTSNSI